ncbi:hypothetical protein Anapl_14166 [Anas platyrhynchos]|uniref:Uncharacterized protein n=1 Tax=Anas platyrhynchos TaxID=8839 RepID=R0LHL8_ANAPL|nr:hypothetical protein Anapl_14166 [Anas platyrhynchos]
MPLTSQMRMFASSPETSPVVIMDMSEVQLIKADPLCSGLCGCSEEPGGAGWWLSTDNQRVGAHAGLAQGATGVWYPLFAARAFWWQKPHIHHWQCLRTLCLDLKKYMVGGWDHWPHGSQDDWAVVLPFGLLHVSCKRPFAGRFAETCKLMSLMTANSSEIMVSKWIFFQRYHGNAISGCQLCLLSTAHPGESSGLAAQVMLILDEAERVKQRVRGEEVLFLFSSCEKRGPICPEHPIPRAGGSTAPHQAQPLACVVGSEEGEDPPFSSAPPFSSLLFSHVYIRSNVILVLGHIPLISLWKNLHKKLEQAEFLNQETVVEVTEPTPHHDVDSLPQLAANQFLSENADLGSPPQSLNPSIADGLQRERQKPCKIQPTLGC